MREKRAGSVMDLPAEGAFMAPRAAMFERLANFKTTPVREGSSAVPAQQLGSRDTGR